VKAEGAGKNGVPLRESLDPGHGCDADRLAGVPALGPAGRVGAEPGDGNLRASRVE